MRNKICLADFDSFFNFFFESRFNLIYIDPPFNTGKRQERKRVDIKSFGYDDSWSNYYGMMNRALVGCWKTLADDGSLLLHVDYREVHYLKVMLDQVFGRECFMNEIIWSYDYGARSKKRWSPKHDNILWYAKDPKKYTFNYGQIKRIPYMAPGLVGKEKAAKGKPQTDVIWHTIVPTNGKEKTGYATQKPIGLIEQFIRVHSNPGDVVMDCFCGSGTTGEAAAKNDRGFVMCDSNKDAVEITKKRLQKYKCEYVEIDKV